METSKNERVWFITGASRGIGAEIAKAALAAGDRVVATARDPRSITDRFGRPEALLPVALDVTDEASVAAAVEAAVARFGRIDVLVNNAGFGVVGAIEETQGDEVRRVFETNVFGLLAVTRAVLPQLRKQRAGLILNLSSPVDDEHRGRQLEAHVCPAEAHPSPRLVRQEVATLPGVELHHGLALVVLAGLPRAPGSELYQPRD